ncbi:hypothetical protein GCM10022243_28540 [Saccharothrix violaceirubra]|uniref:Uncharacterized protein n=1 Tax=Saccharothrix violaceirubra TaxID=413306 RepID=A0A7W7TA09_9PSEU|nr:hypothetical protein [Saccharothrix violaceirubra]MBB4969221.1 hypothetical protein [Saccharothrix violaceirubra]
MSPHPRWKQGPLADEAWRPPTGLSRVERMAEQNSAAGGAAARLKVLADGRTAHASVALRRQPNGRRVYAYLRWSVDGRTRERYVCEVDRSTRADNLTVAWLAAHDAGLLRRATQDGG